MKLYLVKKNNGSVAITSIISNNTIEAEIKKWSQEEREEVVLTREITESDLPSDREFRNAWTDATQESRVDIDLAKAKELKLAELRAKRNALLDASDKEMTRALELEDAEKIAALKAARQALRDATEPLKALQVSGYNDESVLSLIKEKAALPA